MSQYFENDSAVLSKEREIVFEFLGKKIKFLTDNGVFSKNYIDEGSIALLKVIAPRQLGKNILDLGCGYGTIGLTLASLYPDALLTCSDINLRALALCKRNAKANKLDDRVTCLESNVYQNIIGKFDSIVVNPPIRAGKKVIYEMFEKGKEHLIEGGSLYIVIRKSHGAKSAEKFIESIYGNITLLKKDKGYYIYQASNK